MAIDAQAQEIDGAVPSTEKERQLEAQLAQLKLLHIKHQELRTTIPRMTESLRAKHATPEAFYAAFIRSVKAANEEVIEFKRLMTSKESAQVFEQADSSRKKNPKGIAPWKARDHPDWLTPDSS